jgi:hypothetical protein
MIASQSIITIIDTIPIIIIMIVVIVIVIIISNNETAPSPRKGHPFPPSGGVAAILQPSIVCNRNKPSKQPNPSRPSVRILSRASRVPARLGDGRGHCFMAHHQTVCTCLCAETNTDGGGGR